MSNSGLIVRQPHASDESPFLRRVSASAELHRSWVSPPATSREFCEYLEKARKDDFLPFVLCEADSGELVGVVDASGIMRGVFLNAYLGFYAFAPFAGRGLMKAGLALVLVELFNDHGLHRVEANIQPENVASKALVRSLGFRHEGFSPRYLNIGGEWRDHERWALLADEFVAL